jgi:superfamily I DNA and/or RNA helicase
MLGVLTSTFTFGVLTTGVVIVGALMPVVPTPVTLIPVVATTNSAAVERLIEERSLFDWSIIEEAGKATGGELLSPLLLSHRRLMIGDHKQLPPYGADRMTRLLASPEKVKTAIRTAQDLISRYLKDPAIEELFDEVEAEVDDFGRLCSDTLSILTLFETMVEAEFARKPRATPLRPIARRLEEQHRMHPAIAAIVSKCFYDGKLSTNRGKAKAYREGGPPFQSTDATRLPDTPIVFIDMPYVRGQHGYRGGDRSPPWSNRDEVEAALQALALLKAAPTQDPSIAILSPYREQVKALRQGINGRLSDSLAHLKMFRPAVGDEDYCGTVDSFQGDQADLVLISMVRNNGHASPTKALGFLRDDRRMNVLLSRAKWRMIIIGSLEFYRNVVELSSAIPEAELGFMKRFLGVLQEAQSDGDAAIVPWARLSGKIA